MRLAESGWHDHRRVSGDDPDDRRVEPGVSVHGRYAARPSAWILKATTARSSPTCTLIRPTTQARPQSWLRLRRAAYRSCRPSRCWTGSTVAMRPRSMQSRGTGRRSASPSRQAAGAHGLQTMLPAAVGQASLASLTKDGAPVGYTRQLVKGISYAMFSSSGSYLAQYSADNTAPVISRRRRHARHDDRDGHVDDQRSVDLQRGTSERARAR